MFQHLLVPLDGSRLAEAALPPAAYLAQRLGAQVTLIHVIEHNAPAEVHGELHLTKPEEAEKYLKHLAATAFPVEAKVVCHVHTAEVGNLARSIVDHVSELAPDLTVMCSHGRSGLRSWIFGRIAQQVIALGKIPVLILRPETTGDKPPFSLQRLLVPLDGNSEHESGLKVATGLAYHSGASLHLLMVVPTVNALSGEWAATRRLSPGATAEMLELATEGGEEYLDKFSTWMDDTHLHISREVERGDPATIMIRKASAFNAIVLATHGKVGLDAFWSGSMVAKILGKTSTPLLLVPVGWTIQADREYLKK